MVGKNKEGGVSKNFILFSIVGFLMLSMYFVFGVHTNSPTTITVDVNQNYTFNITINNSDAGVGGNITFVNITLSSSFTILSINETNGTSGNATVRHINVTNRNIIWYNTTKGISNNAGDNTTIRFWFNATVTTIGTHYINITVSNSTSTVNYTTGITVTAINGAPNITLIYPLRGHNYSTSFVNFTVISVDEVNNVTTCWVSLWGNFTNYTMGRVGYTFNYTNGTDTGSMANGNYQANFWCNDTFNNINSTLSSVNFTLDTLAPSTVNFSFISSGQTTLDFNISISDALSGMTASCVVNRSRTSLATVTGTGSIQNVSDTGLACATSYLYNVTCSDAAGNSNATSVTYSTPACTVTPSSGGGSGGTSHVAETSLSAGYTKKYYAGEAATFGVGGKRHTFLVLYIRNNTATIQVSSVVQKATLAVGEEKKFDIDEDGKYYDLSVKLNSVASNKADITLKSINEAITAEGSGAGETGGAGEENGETGGAGAKGSSLIWLIVIIVVIVVLVVAWLLMKKKNS